MYILGQSEITTQQICIGKNNVSKFDNYSRDGDTKWSRILKVTEIHAQWQETNLEGTHEVYIYIYIIGEPEKTGRNTATRRNDVGNLSISAVTLLVGEFS